MEYQSRMAGIVKMISDKKKKTMIVEKRQGIESGNMPSRD
jgi:hypothetical protein